MTKYLKNTEDGEIMHYSERLARHPKMKLVTEREAFPERFADKPVAERILVVRATVDKAPVAEALAVPEAVVTPPAETTVTPELMADGARGFGRNVGITTEAGKSVEPPKPKEDSNALPAGLAGLENV